MLIGNVKRKQNLLLDEYKHKYVNKKIKMIVLGYTIIIGSIGLYTYSQYNSLDNSVDALRKETDEYTLTENKVKSIEKTLQDKQFQLMELKEVYYPFSKFMDYMVSEKPANLVILSIENNSIVLDIEEKMKKEAEEAKKKEEEANASAKAEENIGGGDITIGGSTSPTPTVTDTGQFLTTEDTGLSGEVLLDGENVSDESEVTEKESLIDKNKEYTTLKYKQDLRGTSLRLRGYSESEGDISKYVNYLKKDNDFIQSLVIIGVEEKALEDGTPVVLFELLINLKNGGSLKNEN